MNLSDKWEAHAQEWIRWAQTPGHDSYGHYHRDQFLQLLPLPGRQTLDIGCGEGRLARDLKKLGHRVIAVDASPSLVVAAREADPSMDVRLADAAALPLSEASVDLAIAFMSLNSIDAMPAAIHEAARVLEPGGKLCTAIVHPINSAGRFVDHAADAPFMIKGDYLHPFEYADSEERDGLTMTFCGHHEPLESYFVALEAAGFLVETLRESRVPDHAVDSDAKRRWQRLPLFLHLRARRA
jgi:SAM-dependent methyltransferase